MLNHPNSRIEGLRETEGARRYFGIKKTIRERWKYNQLSPANKRIRLIYRTSMADRKSYQPFRITRQQRRAK